MDVLKYSAAELGRLIKKKEIGVREITEAYFQQIERKESQIGAYLYRNKEQALKQAEEVQKGIEEGRYQGPLAGVPIAVKDNICTEGIATTCASRILENFVPPYSATAVENLKNEGVILLGKTNMDEFAMGSTTETSAFGVTRNPWNTDHVPGGSSGGSCAAVAAGEAALAIGSDTGGSIRQPSAYCGVTGLKPTYGTVSRYGLIAYGSSLDQIGPVGKNTEDCAAALEVLASYDNKDSTSVKRENGVFTSALSEDIKGFRIGVPREYLKDGMQKEVKDAVLETAEDMEAAGAIVEFFDLGMTDYMIPAYYIIACAEASSNLERFDGVKYGFRAKEYEGLHDLYKQSRSLGFGEEVKKRIMLGSFVLSAGYYDDYYLKALKAKAMIKVAFDSAFQKYDVILAPAAPATAPKLGESLKDPMQMYLSDIYTVAVNLAGLPGISVPGRIDEKGLPVGIQFIGNCFQEAKILHAAYSFEKLRGDWKMAFESWEEDQKWENSMRQ